MCGVREWASASSHCATEPRGAALPEQYRKTVIRTNGDVAQTFLVDGFVAGAWRVEDRRVAPEPFAPLSRSARLDIEDEAGRLEAFLAD